MKHAYLFATLALLTGCTTFSTTQSDESQDAQGVEHQVKTQVRVASFLSARSTMQGWKASQTGKTQGASIGSVDAGADGATNIAAIAGAIVGAAVKAAVKP